MGRKPLTVTFFGQEGVGKTTAHVQTAWLTGNISENDLKVAAQAATEADEEESKYAWVEDTTKEERENATTGYNKFRLFISPDSMGYTIDTPSDVTRTADLAAALSIADCGILVVDKSSVDLKTSEVSEATSRMIKIAGFLGVPQLVCAVNKLEDVSDQKDTFNGIISIIAKRCKQSGFDPANIAFLPVSAYQGQQIIDESFKFVEWFPHFQKKDSTPAWGKTLVDAINLTITKSADRNMPARAHVLKTWSNSDGRLTVLGRVASGKITTGMEVAVTPYYEGTVRVVTIRNARFPSDTLDTADTHGTYEFTFNDDDVDVRVGSVIAPNDDDSLEAAESFDSTFQMLSKETNFADGDLVDVYVHIACVSCRVKILSVAQRNGPARENPGSMSFAQRGTVNFTPLKPLVVAEPSDEAQEPKSLTRFMVGKNHQPIGPGIVKTVY